MAPQSWTTQGNGYDYLEAGLWLQAILSNWVSYQYQYLWQMLVFYHAVRMLDIIEDLLVAMILSSACMHAMCSMAEFAYVSKYQCSLFTNCSSFCLPAWIHAS